MKRYIKDQAQLRKVMRSVWRLPASELDSECKEALTNELYRNYRDLTGAPWKKPGIVKAVNMVALLMHLGISRIRSAQLVSCIDHVHLKWPAILQRCKDQQGEYLKRHRSFLGKRDRHWDLTAILFTAMVLDSHGTKKEFHQYMGMTKEELEQKVGRSLDDIRAKTLLSRHAA